MRALLAQLEPASADVGRNLERVREVVEDNPDAGLAIFPELFLSGYRLQQAAGLALTLDSPEIAFLRRLAAKARTGLIVGAPERCKDGQVANVAVCVDRDGSLAGVYRKTHLFGAGENATFTAGNSYQLVHVAGISIGPLICFEVEFPEPPRALAQAGADLIVTIAANMEPYGEDHALLVRVRALENRRPHLYVNRVGEDDGLHFVGGSQAVDPNGRVLAVAPADAEAVLTVTIPEGRVAKDVDYLTQVRPSLPTRRPDVAGTA